MPVSEVAGANNLSRMAGRTNDVYIRARAPPRAHPRGRHVTSPSEIRRKRLLFRSWHRGTRESDLILGRFADVHIDALSDCELDEYEHLMDALETDLLAWVTGVADVPADQDTAMFRRVR